MVLSNGTYNLPKMYFIQRKLFWPPEITNTAVLIFAGTVRLYYSITFPEVCLVNSHNLYLRYYYYRLTPITHGVSD